MVKGKIRGAARRYYGRARARAGKTTIPLMGIATAGALTAGLLGNTTQWGTPVEAIGKGDYAGAGVRMLDNFRNPNTYWSLVLPVGVWLVGRSLVGKRKLSKRWSVF